MSDTPKNNSHISRIAYIALAMHAFWPILGFIVWCWLRPNPKWGVFNHFFSSKNYDEVAAAYTLGKLEVLGIGITLLTVIVSGVGLLSIFTFRAAARDEARNEARDCAEPEITSWLSKNFSSYLTDDVIRRAIKDDETIERIALSVSQLQNEGFVAAELDADDADKIGRSLGD